MRLSSLVVMALAASAVTVSARAHHSHGNYDLTGYTHLTGTVTQLHWVNPHAWVYIDVVEPDGTKTTWALEAAGGNTLNRRGISRELVEVGDTVSVRCHRLRDGSTGCLLGFLTAKDGVEREWD